MARLEQHHCLPHSNSNHSSTHDGGSDEDADAGEAYRAPVIDIDANNVAFRDTKTPIQFISDCVSCGVNEGIETNVIADNRDRRHSSKRASYIRAARRERSRLDCVELNMKLNAGLQNNVVNEEINAISKQLEEAESEAQKGLPRNFTESLGNHISSIDTPLAIFREAQLQADPVIARRYLKRESDLIISNDSDFFAHYPEITLIRKFVRKKRDGKLCSLILATASRRTAATITWILKARYDSFKDVQIFSVPKFPVFDNENDAECRALIACAMGNDYWVGGQKKFGPAAAMELVKEAANIGNCADRRIYILDKIGLDRKVSRQLKISVERNDATFGFQQMSEANDINFPGTINGNHLQLLKLDVLQTGQKRIAQRMLKRKLICNNEDESRQHSSLTKRHKSNIDSNKSSRDLKFCIQDLVPRKVKRWTGFVDIVSMLCFMLTVCGADIDVMTTTNSEATWLEEWFFYFVWAYGRVHMRLEDIAETFEIRFKTVPSILQCKLHLIVSCRERWPMYASLDEDEALRSKHWNDMLRRSGNIRRRIVMHDMSDFPLDNPEDAELNRALFSLYYGGSCGKGGIFTQFCGWQGTYDLFTGAVGDSEYVRLSKILETQQSFQEHDKALHEKVTPFINIFDKGYRVVLECREHGGQLCWQPAFARTDERYGSYATLLTAAVAYTRSGNERSVKHLKHSWRIARGCKGMPRSDLSTISDLWLAWMFQTNWMYGRVH